MSALHPIVTWADRKETAFITVDLPNAENEKIDLQETGLSFTAKVGDKQYAFSLTFPEKVDTSMSKHQKNRLIHILLHKQEAKRWSKITTETGRLHWLKCDWNKWVDSDDERPSFDNSGYGDIDFSQFNNFGGLDPSSMYDNEGSDVSSDAELGMDPMKAAEGIDDDDDNDNNDTDTSMPMNMDAQKCGTEASAEPKVQAVSS